MIKLIYETPDSHKAFTAVESVEIKISDERDLADMLDAYRHFLLAIGYQVNGELEVAYPDDVEDWQC